MCAFAQLCPTLGTPLDYSLPGSSVHGDFLARVPEWVAVFSSRGSSAPGMKPTFLMSHALQANSLPAEPWGKPPNM